MTKLLVVVGVTGLQGRSVAEWVQKNEPSWKIRGLTRNPSSEAAVTLSHSGIEIVKADLNDIDSLQAAFKGGNYIFVYTDFGGIVQSADVMGKFTAGEIEAPIGKEASKIEEIQGRNVADAASKVPELERLIWSAMPDVKKWSHGKYTQAFHFDAKAAVTEYMLGLPGLKGKIGVLHLGVFNNNVFKFPDMFGISMQEDKTALWKTICRRNTVFPWIDIERDIGAFVKVLIDAPAPTQALGASEWMSCDEWLRLWSARTGVPSHFEEIPHEEWVADDKVGLKAQMSDIVNFIDEFGYTGGDPDVIMPDELEKRGFPVARTSVADYMAREDWSSLIDAAA